MPLVPDLEDPLARQHLPRDRQIPANGFPAHWVPLGAGDVSRYPPLPIGASARRERGYSSLHHFTRGLRWTGRQQRTSLA